MPARSRAATEVVVVPQDVLPALPGEQVEEAALVDEVVLHVNRIYVARGLETAREIGEYLLSRFFDGDPAKFHARCRKHASFRKLAQRDDLRPSYAFLWSACAVVDQLRLLPEDVREALPLSHHRLLLPVKDEATKVRLAQKAVEKGLSKRALEAEVRRAQTRAGGTRRSGRPPLPSFAKGLTRLAGAVRLATAEAVTADAFTTYSPTKARALLEELEEQVQALGELKAEVEAAIAAWEAE